MSDTKKSVSKGQVRAKIQELINENTRPAIGRFHTKELNESGLINDLVNNFDFTLKKN